MQREHVRSLIGRGARRLLLPVGVLDLSVIYRKDLTRPLRPFSARTPVEISTAVESDIDEIVKLSPYHDARILGARLEAGSICFVARVDGRIVGFNWTVFGRGEDEYYRIVLQEGDVYCMDAHTAEAYRGNGIHTELLYRMLVHAQESGYRHAYTRVSAMNTSSWKTHQRLDWEETGTTYVFRPLLIPTHGGLFGPAVYPVEPIRGNAAA